MENNKYILRTDSFDDKVFSICLFDEKNNSVRFSESMMDEREFEKRVVELEKHYNCYRIEEAEVNKVSKNRVYSRVPNISQAMGEYLRTDKGRNVFKDCLFETDAIDYKLIEELRNLK